MTTPLISRSLELPTGYQHFHKEWFTKSGQNDHGVFLNAPHYVKQVVESTESEGYVYTQHEIFLDGVFKHTRSSPNFDGGLVTYATCKHLMRTYRDPSNWEGIWLVGLCPKHCVNNAIFFMGQVDRIFLSNWQLSRYIRLNYEKIYDLKMASNNPRGDLYSPLVTLQGRPEEQIYDHNSYREPKNHTRSLEFYKKSPGSTSERPDGKIPKWWRDIEYSGHAKRPPTFILSPCFLFSKPMLWTDLKPGRASLRVSTAQLAASLRGTPPR